ncbi:MAG TPA: hypothetical protein VFM18_16405 [Methanosarcina sp.]|nr:hypothetical protein [Methanosarcina sp.]
MLSMTQSEFETAVREYIKNNLRISIDTKTTSEYMGGMDGGDLYRDHTTVTVSIELEDETISESAFSV